MPQRKRTGSHAPPTVLTGSALPVQRFTVDITLSGLCLLVRHPQQRKLVVLLPHAHALKGEVPEHLAVLGAHGKYRPEGPFEPRGRFHEYELGDGRLVFEDRLDSDDAVRLDFRGLEVADLSEVENRPPDPELARLSMEIDRGAVCEECVHDSGATWFFNWKKQRMATRLTWRVERVCNTSGNLPGVAIVYHPSAGPSKRFVIHAVKDSHAPNEYRAAFYLYHAPRTELPSHAGHPEDPEIEFEVNHHFGAYFDLFDPPLRADLPERVPDEEEEGDEDETAEGEGNAALAQELGLPIPSLLAGLNRMMDPTGREARDAARLFGFQGFHGRLYTCTLATAVDRQSLAEAGADDDATPEDA